MWLYFLTLASLASLAVAENQFTYNGTTYNTTDKLNKTAQVSLLFPRNTTYAPQTFMPLIMAIDNYPGILALQPRFSYSLYNATAATEAESALDYSGTNGIQELTASHQRSFWLKGIYRNTLKEGQYQLSVSIQYTNCSVGEYCGGAPCREDGDFHLSSSNCWSYDTYFTISKDAKRDLGFQSMFDGIRVDNKTAECNRTGAVAFNVVDYVPLPAGVVYRPPPLLPYCAVLAVQAPAPDPCKSSVYEEDARLFNQTIYAGGCWQHGQPVACSLAGETVARAKAAWAVSGAAMVWIMAM